MDKGRILEYCKYYDDGACPYRKAFREKLDALIASGTEVGSLQPRCPRDAQGSKRGILSCLLERKDKLC